MRGWFGVDLHHLRGAISSLRSTTGLEDELYESCGGDVEDESLPEVVDHPRQDVRNCPFCIQLFSPPWPTDPLRGVSVVFAEFSK